MLTSLAGMAALVVALSAHGERETLTTGQFLLGGGYVTGHVSASASLRYYVATAVCLLLGTAGLAVPDQTGGAAPPALGRHRHRPEPRHHGASLRAREGGGADELDASGRDHLAGARGGSDLPAQRPGRRQGVSRACCGGLIAYALASRGAVALLMVIASTLAARDRTTTSAA